MRFLYGNCGLKTNKAVISRDNDLFLIETEDKNLTIESFSFSKEDVEDIKIMENISSKSGWNSLSNFATSESLCVNT